MTKRGRRRRQAVALHIREDVHKLPYRPACQERYAECQCKIVKQVKLTCIYSSIDYKKEEPGKGDAYVYAHEIINYVLQLTSRILHL